ncbi:UNVERIFIED_ORG: hypothetical protein EDC93_11027 [Bacillus cereus]
MNEELLKYISQLEWEHILSIEWKISLKETLEFYRSINQETVLLWLINIRVNL